MEQRISVADAFFSASVMLPRGARLSLDGSQIEFDDGRELTAHELMQIRMWVNTTMPRLPLSPHTHYRDG